MRRLFVLLVLLATLAASSQSQDLGPLQFYLTAGAHRASSNGDEGYGITLESARRIVDNISVGLRLQLGILDRAVKMHVEGNKFWSQDDANVSSLCLRKVLFHLHPDFFPTLRRVWNGGVPD